VTAAPPHAEDHTRVVFLSLVLAGMAYALSQTVVSPALPELERAYHATAASVAWILTGYLLAASVATPIVGKLGDVYGRARVLTAVLRELGYEPYDDDGVTRLRNCPFHAVAQRQPELICDMNLALLHGLTDGLDGSGLNARLEPAPGRCCVALHRTGRSAPS
jgi:predicted ArsR family transcriptional regulator